MYKELVSEINHRYSQSTTLNMSIVVANCVQKVTVFFVVEITNLLEERKAGHLTVVTVDGGVQCLFAYLTTRGFEVQERLLICCVLRPREDLQT